MSVENEALARRFFEELCNQGNGAVADEIVSADYVSHGPQAPPAERCRPIPGRDFGGRAASAAPMSCLWPHLWAAGDHAGHSLESYQRPGITAPKPI